MYAKQPDGFAVKEEITDYSPNLELIFQLEGNKSAYLNPPYTHNRIQGNIRLWDRLKIDNAPRRRGPGKGGVYRGTGKQPFGDYV